MRRLAGGERGPDGGGQRRHPDGEGEVGGGLEGVAQAGLVLEKVEGLGPFRPGHRVEAWADEALVGIAAVDHGGQVDGADIGHGVEDGSGEGRVVFGVELVEVEPGGLPILVDADGEVEERLFFEPGDVGADLGGLAVAVIAVEVVAAGGLAGVAGEAGGVEAGAEPEPGARGECVLGEQLADREGAGGFVAVDAGGEVKSGGPGGG